MKLDIFSKKNILDERQEQTLCKLESRGFWLLWWGLLAVIIFQWLMGKSAEDLAAEGLLFLAACLYMLVECIRNGIWDRHIKPTAGANVVGCLVAGAVVFLSTLMQTGYWPGALLAGGFTAVLCFFALQFTVLLYKKRHDQLENLEDDEDEHTDTNQ